MIKQKEEKNLIVGLDIGTSKIVAIVAVLQPDGLLNVIGLGQHSSKGLKKGVVINIDSTMASARHGTGIRAKMIGISSGITICPAITRVTWT